MKKIACFLVILANMFVSKSVNNEGYNQYINKSYIVMNATNNEIIEGKDVNLIRSVASVSKIMTAIVAIEEGDLDKEVTISKEDIDTYGSSIYLQENQKIKLIDLLYGLMLRSGNDDSNAIARAVGGTREHFIEMMNNKAKQIGMKNSTFNNPSGLDVDETGNLSTSYDLALLMSYAIKNNTFLKISSSKEYKNDKFVWSNKNKLLKTYKYTIAGKTGFTYKAKRTLVTAARKDETTFVIVSLDCGNDFNFHKFLYERNFEKYESKLLLEKGDNYLEEYDVVCENDVYVTINKNEIDEYSLVYKLKDSKARVYLMTNDSEKEVATCSFKVLDTKMSKKSFIKRIKDWFK